VDVNDYDAITSHPAGMLASSLSMSVENKNFQLGLK